MSKDKKNQYQEWTKDELISEVNRLRRKKKFGLVWEQKNEIIIQECIDNYPTLVEEKSKKIGSIVPPE